MKELVLDHKKNALTWENISGPKIIFKKISRFDFNLQIIFKKLNGTMSDLTKQK